MLRPCHQTATRRAMKAIPHSEANRVPFEDSRQQLSREGTETQNLQHHSPHHSACLQTLSLSVFSIVHPLRRMRWNSIHSWTQDTDILRRIAPQRLLLNAAASRTSEDGTLGFVPVSLSVHCSPADSVGVDCVDDGSGVGDGTGGVGDGTGGVGDGTDVDDDDGVSESTDADDDDAESTDADDDDGTAESTDEDDALDVGTGGGNEEESEEVG